MSRLRAAARWLDDRDLTGHPRYRAWERRRVLAAVRAGAVTVLVVQLTDVLLLGPSRPALLVVNVPVVMLCLALLYVVRRSGTARRRPYAGIFLLGAIAVTATLLPIGLIPALAPLMVAYLPILLVASALFIPWSVRWHSLWLAAALAAVAAFDSSALSVPLVEHGVSGLFPIMFAAAATSFGGHALLQHERQRAFAQRMQLRRLNQTVRRHRRELQALADQLEAVARRDPLTGVRNRLRLDEDMGAVRTMLDGSTRPTAAILLDIDHFKDYNDAHGHLAGDEILREVARTIAVNLRPTDLLYRFGGEEFLVLLLDTDEAGAMLAAERIRAAVVELDVPSPANAPWDVLTVSAGVAPIHPDARTDEWLRLADDRLYASKAAGRNQVTGTLEAAPRSLAGSASAA